MKRKMTALLLAVALLWTSLPVSAREDQEQIRLAEEG